MSGTIAAIVGRRLAAPGSLIVMLLVLVGSAPDAAGAVAPAAPAWSLEAIDGRTVSFHDQLARGPVVVSFWATWCKPCLKELPHLDRIAGEYGDRLTVLAVSTDASKSVAKVAPFVRSRGWENLTVLLDPGARVQELLQVGPAVPFLIVFDTHGREIYRHIGYKEGDERELEAVLRAAVDGEAPPHGEAPPAAAPGRPDWAETVTATDRFEYSYDTDTRREIFENWLDVAYRFGDFRTGVMLNSRAPSEEGDRSNEIAHRYFEFARGDVLIRAGHFTGIFGRGLVFNAYEDRTVRVDTRLDGLYARYEGHGVKAQAFSGTPLAADVDLRGLDLEVNPLGGLQVGVTGLTYRPDDYLDPMGRVHRENVVSGRIRQNFGWGDYYVEAGAKTGYDYDPFDDEADFGRAWYGNLNLYAGAFSASFEASDYERFEVVSRADGTTALNQPPALARELTWTLLNRAPHTLNANDEVGRNLDLLYSGDDGLSVLLSGADIERQDGGTVYQLAYASVASGRRGDFRLVGAFGYQDSKGLRQTAAAELTWFATESHSFTLQAEQQHVRPEGSPAIDPGAWDQQWFKLEYEMAPRWAFAAIVETNNKYDEQREPGEGSGPFPAGQISWSLPRGGDLNLWFGERQAGYLCSGGVCKYEPAFAGVELFGTFRY